MSSTTIGVFTVTTPMPTLFTPPSSCSTHWTYEAQTANNIPGGLLMQDAQLKRPDSNCFPTGFSAWGRAPSFIQVFSPGACPIGYTAAVNNFNGETTTEVCCPRHFLFTSTISTVKGNDKTAAFFGCTSIYPASAGVTTVFVEGDGFTSDLDGTPSNFVSVSGPVTMWAQPITVAFQKSDLSLFTNPTAQVTSARTATSTSTTTSSSTATSSSSSTGTSLISSTKSPLPSTRPDLGLSHGTIAGIAIGAAAVLGLFIGLAIFFQRKQKSVPSPSGVHDTRPSYQDQMQGQYRQPAGDPRQQNMYGEHHYNTIVQQHPDEWWKVMQQTQPLELSNHTDRRLELG